MNNALVLPKDLSVLTNKLFLDSFVGEYFIHVFFNRFVGKRNRFSKKNSFIGISPLAMAPVDYKIKPCLQKYRCP